MEVTTNLHKGEMTYGNFEKQTLCCYFTSRWDRYDDRIGWGCDSTGAHWRYCSATVLREGELDLLKKTGAAKALFFLIRVKYSPLYGNLYL